MLYADINALLEDVIVANIVSCDNFSENTFEEINPHSKCLKLLKVFFCIALKGWVLGSVIFNFGDSRVVCKA